jgi:hypothetical protein
MITDEAIEAANRRGRELQARNPKVSSVKFDRKTGRIVIHFLSNLDVMFDPQEVQGLEHAKPSQLADIEVSPSGLGLHFQKIDADVYIPALLQGVMGSRKWMASRLGSEGGKSRSAEKKLAARANGKLGGRPRKIAV